jgi:hypothetical protein
MEQYAWHDENGKVEKHSLLHLLYANATQKGSIREPQKYLIFL